MVKVNDVAFIDNTSKRIAAYLKKTHSETKDWGMKVPLDLLKQKEETQNIFTIVMGAIAGIVGGIGIMNIMLIGQLCSHISVCCCLLPFQVLLGLFLEHTLPGKLHNKIRLMFYAANRDI